MTNPFGLESEISDLKTYQRTQELLQKAKIQLPTFGQLTDPSLIPDSIKEQLANVNADEVHPLNLFRVHWFNNENRDGFQEIPAHIVLPKALTGVDAPIIVMLGDRFPMISAHKVLAAYACLVPRLVSGTFDPENQRAIWPSTGNYCRGGVAISRILECRGVAVLPEGMSKERFHWLASWVLDPEKDIIRTFGTESNVKEIYDKCNELKTIPENVVLNQFAEFGNHLVHFQATGSALEKVFLHLQKSSKDLRLSAFVSATGSGGSIAAGDYLKEKFGSETVAVEALECPTMLYNGFGEHNIQGIGDKHVPLIQNVMNIDFATALSDVATDKLFVLFNSEVGQQYLINRRKVPKETVHALKHLGLSSIANVLAAIKTAKYLGLKSSEALITVATDGAAMYNTESDKILKRDFPQGFDPLSAAEVFGQFLLAQTTDHFQELTKVDRKRIFNLGYFTWVEQQNVAIEDFQKRADPRFWKEIRKNIPLWDELITQFNQKIEPKNK